MNLLQSSILRVTRSFAAAKRGWLDFWWNPADGTTLGMIRVLTGFMLLYNLLVWGSDLEAFFASDGLQPAHAIQRLYEGSLANSFWFYVPDEWLYAVHWVCVAIVLMFALGLGTRVTSVCAFVITVSYSQRVPVANFGLDQILGMLCLYLAVGPSGTCLSLDAWLKRRRAARLYLPEPPTKLAGCRMALRLIQLHMCVIYFWAGFAKLKGEVWWTGEAMWGVLANEEYQTTDLTWMAWLPWLPAVVGYATVLWEIYFCVLVWNRRLRPIMLAIGTAMHFGIGAFLGMWTFGLIMTYAYFSFSCPDTWRRRLQRLFRARSFASAEEGGDADDPESAVVGEDALQEPIDEEQPVAKLEPITSVISGNLRAGCGHDQTDPHAPAWDSGDWKRDRADVELESDDDEETVSNALSDEDSTTDVLMLAMTESERITLSAYFEKHDIPVRTATNVNSARHMAVGRPPAVALICGSGMTPRQLVESVGTLQTTLNHIGGIPLSILLTPRQQQLINTEGISSAVIPYPATPREIRSHLMQQALEGKDAGASESRDEDEAEQLAVAD